MVCVRTPLTFDLVNRFPGLSKPEQTCVTGRTFALQIHSLVEFYGRISGRPKATREREKRVCRSRNAGLKKGHCIPAMSWDHCAKVLGNAWAMQNWDEIRTAYLVARLGTVSGAADVLGVHHATVIRHVDALEKQLGTKLFQRHARGYSPTEAGRDLMMAAETAEGQFTQMASRIKGLGDLVTGELVVTTIAGLTRFFTPVLASFLRAHPGVTIRFLSDTRLFRLDHGEAHVAIRAGTTPKEPDYVVQPLAQVGMGLFASKAYLAEAGHPASVADFADHRFISVEGLPTRAPFYVWLHEHVPKGSIAFTVTEPVATELAILEGVGIGFLPVREAARFPDLVEVMPPLPEWVTPLWAVTHIDLHRTLKVQSFLTHLKAAAQGWSSL
jgi:DNA-binding transcriptional LysR family regulator